MEMTKEEQLAELRDAGIENVEEAPDERAPLSKRRQETIRQSNLLEPLVRVALGGRALREIYRAANFGKMVHERFALLPWLNQLTSPKNLPYLLKQADTLNFFKDSEGKKVAPPAPEAYSPEQLWGVTDETNEITGEVTHKVNEPNPWAALRAINRAIGKSNFRNFKVWEKDPAKAPKFAYTADHDGKIRQMPFTGVMTWTPPEMVTLSWRPANSEEDFLRPFMMKYITDPDNPDQEIQVKVYRRVGNAFHSVNEDDENQTLRQALTGLTTGDSTTVDYHELFRDENNGADLTQTEFERRAESDMAFVDRIAQEDGINLFCYCDYETRRITIYHAGYRGMAKAVS